MAGVVQQHTREARFGHAAVTHSVTPQSGMRQRSAKHAVGKNRIAGRLSLSCFVKSTIETVAPGLQQMPENTRFFCMFEVEKKQKRGVLPMGELCPFSKMLLKRGLKEWGDFRDVV